ncbi:trypsin-like serine peptidase [Actinoplanes teichomyceticus]|uniref:Serine protease n=1 Tax=Actinoplanes teichomyceticus TaxID=1867 RepID=A0A561WKR7_ACTTI|nr:serine protease [Actinoplanes teichomyceticus]TWG24462.1 trypsin-like peptidase [Actinoplanes teichomyceticus]GIF12687.1 hypothetical protein Ate01nite_27190 [Actinoplanes teichomyceticus]
MTDLLLRIDGVSHRLAEADVWYLTRQRDGLVPTRRRCGAGELGHFVSRRGRWYYRTGDPAALPVRLNGRVVQDPTTRLPRGPVHLTWERPAGPVVRDVQRSGYDEAAIVRAVHAACPRYEDLELLLADDLRLELFHISPPADMRWVVDEVIRTARAYGWLTDLLTAVRFAHPREPALDPVMPRFDQESMVDEANGLSDPFAFAARLVRACPQVCQIDVTSGSRRSAGTGFLVGPHIVLTNYHVLRDVLDEPGSPARVAFTFDLHEHGDARFTRRAPLRLAVDWRLAASPPEELDYVLARLDGVPGYDELPTGERRGWLCPSGAAIARPSRGMRLVILQHPRGVMLKQAFGDVLGVDGAGTRLTHRVNTMTGSSGSPCYDVDHFRLIAVHRAGAADSGPAACNTAVPVQAIHADLTARRFDFDLLTDF